VRTTEEIKEAIDLVQRFHDENSDRDAEVLARGEMPDMVDALLCSAQLSALTWFLDEEEALEVCAGHYGTFATTLERHRKRYPR
jgi:hypothetical protein